MTTSDETTNQADGATALGRLFLVLMTVYVIGGVLWADAHPDDRNTLIGFDVVDFLSQVLLWPLHLVGILPF